MIITDTHYFFVSNSTDGSWFLSAMHLWGKKTNRPVLWNIYLINVRFCFPPGWTFQGASRMSIPSWPPSAWSRTPWTRCGTSGRWWMKTAWSRQACVSMETSRPWSSSSPRWKETSRPSPFRASPSSSTLNGTRWWLAWRRSWWRCTWTVTRWTRSPSRGKAMSTQRETLSSEDWILIPTPL